METRVRSVFRVSRLSGYTSVFKETVAASFLPSLPPCEGAETVGSELQSEVEREACSCLAGPSNQSKCTGILSAP